VVRQCLRVRELRAVYSFSLHRMKERFDRRIVRHLPAKAVHALHEAKFCEPVAKGVGAVFGATVAVKNSPWLRLPLHDGVIECPQGEIGVPPSAHGPTDDTSGVLVQDDGEIAPFAPCSKVRDVSGPDLVRSGWDDSIAMVRDAVEELLYARLQAVDPRTASLDALAAHQPFDTLAPDTDAVFAQSVVDSWAAVQVAALAVNRLDL